MSLTKVSSTVRLATFVARQSLMELLKL
jgi:hypothetical protein